MFPELLIDIGGELGGLVLFFILPVAIGMHLQNRKERRETGRQ
jgi:hypothetical protein